MFSRHISHQLAGLLDEEVTLAERKRIEDHLAVCGQCSAEREQIRIGMSMLKHLPPAEAPGAIWNAIEASWPQPQRSVGLFRRGLRQWLPAYVALAIVAAAGIAYWTRVHHHERLWEVVKIQSSPGGGKEPIRKVAGVGPGDWIE